MDCNNDKNNKIENIGIMGGTFDPVHYGHVGLAVSAKDELLLDKVIIIPAFIQPFKRYKNITSDVHRLSMLEMAFSDKDGIEISTWEIERGGISYTYDTLSYFNSIHQDSKIWFIMGGDSLMKLENWHKGIELLKSFSFAVGTRPMDDNSGLINKIEYLHEKYGTEIILIKKEMLPINSTMVREFLEEEKPISGLVSPEVENYIYENKLYI